MSGPDGAAVVPATGVFSWDVPPDADGWYDVLVHGALPDGRVNVHRYQLLADRAAPTPRDGGLVAEASGATEIAVTCPTCLDASGPVEYRLLRDGVPASDWQSSRRIVSAGLSPNTAYEFRVETRDSSPGANAAVLAGGTVAFTPAASPAAPVLVAPGPDRLLIAAMGEDDNPPETEIALYNRTGACFVGADGQPSESAVWQLRADWVTTEIGGLEPGTKYSVQAWARNAAGIETGPGLAAQAYTDRETGPPTVADLHVDQGPGSITLVFSEAVAISKKDLILTSGAGAQVDLADAVLEHSPGSGTATLRLAARPAPGHYRLTVNGSHVQDLSANLIDGDADGAGGDDFVRDVLIAPPGDANADGGVDFLDYLTVKAHLVTAAGASWEQGDADCDGDVDADDLEALESAFGSVVSPPPAGGEGADPAGPSSAAVAEGAQGPAAKEPSGQRLACPEPVALRSSLPPVASPRTVENAHVTVAESTAAIEADAPTGAEDAGRDVLDPLRQAGALALTLRP